MILDKYNLKKDATVMIGPGILHMDPEIWGPDAHEFNPARFLDQPSSGSAPRGIPPAAFRPFGGGATICPGRHFVTAEILGVVALLILRFDAQPLDAVWHIPETKNADFGDSVFPPKKDVEVCFTPSIRNGWIDGDWTF